MDYASIVEGNIAEVGGGIHVNGASIYGGILRAKSMFNAVFFHQEYSLHLAKINFQIWCLRNG